MAVDEAMKILEVSKAELANPTKLQQVGQRLSSWGAKSWLPGS
jgi:hypothetical protein